MALILAWLACGLPTGLLVMLYRYIQDAEGAAWRRPWPLVICMALGPITLVMSLASLAIAVKRTVRPAREVD